MSWKATAWAEQQTTGSPARKVLLLVLANYSDENGYCWPSQEILAKGTEQSLDTIQRQLKRLADGGLISISVRPQTGGRWPSRTYRLNMVTEATVPQPARDRAADCGMVTEATVPQPARDRAATSTVTVPQALRLKPSIEPSIRKNARKRAGEPAGFAKWYETYPKRKSPKDALRAYAKVIASGEIGEADLLTRTEGYAASWRGKALQFCPYPASWLNKGSYADEPDTPSRAAAAAPAFDPATATTEQWQRCVALYERTRQWGSHWGPSPNDPGCLVPIELLQKLNHQTRGHQ